MVVIAGIIKGMKSSLSLCQTWLKACLRNFIPKSCPKMTWFQSRVRSFQCLAWKPARIVKHVPPQWRRFSIRLSSIYNISWAGVLFPQISYLQVNSFHFLYTVFHRSEARLPHVYASSSSAGSMAATQFSQSPVPFMGLFYYSHMLASSPECSLSDSNGSSPASETPTWIRVDWTKEETIILLDTWSCVYESLKSASVSQRKALWAKILQSFLSKCREAGLTTNRNLDQV